MYAVVGCSNCRALWVVEDRPETTQCPRCRTSHRFGRLKAFAETDSADAAVRALVGPLGQQFAPGAGRRVGGVGLRERL